MDNEREKQKEVLRSLVNQYGLNPRELKCLAEDFILELDSGIVLSLEELIKRSPKVVPGWFAFAGGKFSPNPNAYRNCQGVVGWVNPDPHAPVGRRGLTVTPYEVRRIWSYSQEETDIRNPVDGKENTQNLIAYGRRYGIRFPAAEWCYSYSQNGVNPGEGFLPSTLQGTCVGPNSEIINSSLNRIGGDILDGYYFASDKENYKKAGCFLASSGWGYSDYKDTPSDRTSVRCFLAF